MCIYNDVFCQIILIFPLRKIELQITSITHQIDGTLNLLTIIFIDTVE